MKQRLKRLEKSYVTNPCYFVTTCTFNRNKILDNDVVFSILRAEWEQAKGRHGWAIGSFVVMPDHVHFFCTEIENGKPLAEFVGLWKEWTSKKIKKHYSLNGSFWQKGFFDHLIRSEESYSEKWTYVKENPVRQGLVEFADDWSYSGYIDYN